MWGLEHLDGLWRLRDAQDAWVGLGLGYVLVAILLDAFVGPSTEYALLSRPPLRRAHSALTLLLTAAALALLPGPTLQWSLALFIPAYHWGLLRVAEWWTVRRRGRPPLRASRYNMTLASELGAGFGDFAWFLVLHFFPLIIPMLLGSLLGP